MTDNTTTSPFPAPKMLPSFLLSPDEARLTQEEVAEIAERQFQALRFAAAGKRYARATGPTALDVATLDMKAPPAPWTVTGEKRDGCLYADPDNKLTCVRRSIETPTLLAVELKLLRPIDDDGATVAWIMGGNDFNKVEIWTLIARSEGLVLRGEHGESRPHVERNDGTVSFCLRAAPDGRWLCDGEELAPHISPYWLGGYPEGAGVLCDTRQRPGECLGVSRVVCA
jgi:hypothetical protein